MTETRGHPIDIRKLRATFILNPISGRASARGQRRKTVLDFIQRHQLDATLETTTHPGHATAMAREAIARGAELIISVGGDGTMNEVAAALVGTSAYYGMVPTGSGNGLGRDLGVPLALPRALDALLHGEVRAIDTGSVNGLPFFNVMGLGFDAEVGRRFNLTQGRGFLNYVKIGVSAFFAYRKQRITVEPAGAAPFTIDAFLASVANSTQYGNNARIAPRAKLDDGLLDFAAVRSSNLLVALPLVVRMFGGTIDRARAVTTAAAPAFRIHRAAPGPIHTDGEIHDCPAELAVKVLPRSLRVVVPRAHG